MMRLAKAHKPLLARRLKLKYYQHVSIVPDDYKSNDDNLVESRPTFFFPNVSVDYNIHVMRDHTTK